MADIVLKPIIHIAGRFLATFPFTILIQIIAIAELHFTSYQYDILKTNLGKYNGVNTQTLVLFGDIYIPQNS